MRKRDRTNRTFQSYRLCCIGLIALATAQPCEASPSPETSPIGWFVEKSNADLSQGSVHSATDEIALFDAVKSNDVKTAKRLLEAGINVDVKDDQGFTPLMVHLQAQQYDLIPTPMLDLLLRYRPDFDSVGHRGATLWDCLYWNSEPGSSGRDRSAVAVALLKASRDKQKDAGKLLVKAAYHGDTEMIKTLVNQGINLAARAGRRWSRPPFGGRTFAPILP